MWGTFMNNVLNNLLTSYSNSYMLDLLDQSLIAAMETSTSEDEKYLKYWNIVKENPSDFTSWTCLLQTVDQQVHISFISSF